MHTFDDFLEEGREPNKPYVKPHMQNGKQVGWKSSNKWGKVRYWQDFAKPSALKHAGLTEEQFDEQFMPEIQEAYTSRRATKLDTPALRKAVSYWKQQHRNSFGDTAKRMTKDIYLAHRNELDKRLAMAEGISTEKGETTEAGTRHEYRTTRILHNGTHVANIKTYRGRSGGWLSHTENLDGSSAHKKYGIDLMDNKTDMLKKIRDHHQSKTESVQPGSFEHFKHHAVGYIKHANRAAAQEEDNDDRSEDSWEKSREHMNQIRKHYGDAVEDRVANEVTSHKDLSTIKDIHKSTIGK